MTFVDSGKTEKDSSVNGLEDEDELSDNVEGPFKHQCQLATHSLLRSSIFLDGPRREFYMQKTMVPE